MNRESINGINVYTIMPELTTQRKRTIALVLVHGRTLRGFQPPFKIYIFIMVNYLY